MARSSSSNEDFKAEPGHSAGDPDVTMIRESGTSSQLDGNAESDDGLANGISSEMSRQVKQLNVPIGTPEVMSGLVHSGDDILRLATHRSQEPWSGRVEDKSKIQAEPTRPRNGAASDVLVSHTHTTPLSDRQRGRVPTKINSRQEPPRYTSAISSTFPPNLPLSIIRLVESYVNQFVASEAWTSAQGEKAYLLVGWSALHAFLVLIVDFQTRTLTKILSEAEMLSESMSSAYCMVARGDKLVLQIRHRCHCRST